jgi:hypothetical protein
MKIPDKIKNLFCNHPTTAGETYFQHMSFALRAGFRMILAGCCCVIHAIFPFLFSKTAGNTIASLHEKMKKRN